MSKRTRIGSTVTVAVPGFSGPVHVREDGPRSASAMVLVHGFSGSMHWYDRLVALLAETFRLVRVDLLGHGSTGGPAADAPLQARMVDAVLTKLGVTRATAVGHSFGADVVVELAERSDRIERLVIVTQAPDYTDAHLPRGNVIMTKPLVSTVLHRVAVGVGIALNTAVDRTGGRRADRELVARALRDFRALDSAMFRVVLADRARRPLDAQVRSAGKPTLVILGGRDHFYGARSAPRYEAAGARVEILSDSGHSPLVQMPARVAELVRAFAVETVQTDPNV